MVSIAAFCRQAGCARVLSAAADFLPDRAIFPSESAQWFTALAAGAFLGFPVHALPLTLIH
jgi:hypothetical protein